MRRYLAKLDHAFHLLAEAPELGQACDDIRHGYRRLPQGSHVIFYRITPDGIVDIIRVLHERMQPDLHFAEEGDE